ncbi:MAG TPA: hypothetical protein DEP84_04185, partial [Chloroflexi bacterium]|nr:hypothetical protein [Chloroflexota bacterium]
MMKTEVVLPPLGMGMQEGMVVRWLKEEGAHVEAGEAVVEIEADKVTEVVVAPVSGVLAGILVAEGETVSVRQALAVISGHTEPAGEATP